MRVVAIITLASLLSSCGGDGDDDACTSCADDAGVDGPTQGDAGGAACPLMSDRPREPLVQIGEMTKPRANCSFGPDGPVLSSGTLDVSLTSEYFLTVRVENNLAEGIATEYLLLSVGQGPACMPPGGMQYDAFSAVMPMTVDAATVQAIMGPLTEGVATLTVAVEGSDLSGRQFASPDRAFTLQVCDGCLKTNLGACGSTAPPYEVPCYPGQNDPIDCCSSADGGLICPPP